MGLRGLPRSFQCAFHGLLCAMRTERNLRIHLTATVYVTAFGLLAGLEGWGWAAVLLCFGAVIAAELFNTALECLCDAVSPEQNPKIGAAKDTAAGAVLVLAIVALCVGAAVFGPWLLSGGLLERPWAAVMTAATLPPVILWIRGKKS